MSIVGTRIVVYSTASLLLISPHTYQCKQSGNISLLFSTYEPLVGEGGGYLKPDVGKLHKLTDVTNFER